MAAAIVSQACNSLIALPCPEAYEEHRALLANLYSAKSVERAHLRLQAILAFRNVKPKTDSRTGRQLPTGPVLAICLQFRVRSNTLWRWSQIYQRGCHSTQGDSRIQARAGFEALIPRPRGQIQDPEQDRRIKLDSEVREAIMGLYTRRHRPSMTRIWRKLLACCPVCKVSALKPRVVGYSGRYSQHRCPECEFQICYSSVRRIICSIPASVRVLGREGAQAFHNRYGIYIPRSYEDLRNREIFCGDHHEFDLFVHTRGGKLLRSWISAWLDLKTEVLTGWFISTRPNSQTIALAFRHAVLPKQDGIMGLPESIYVDHGKDYRCRYLEGGRKRLGPIPVDTIGLVARAHGLGVFDDPAMEGIWRNLGIRVRHAEPYNAQAKPIERFFGTLERDFVQELPGWCGPKPDLRPVDILKEQIRKHQAWLKGEAEETPFLHISEFAVLFERWLHENYLRTAHARLRNAPITVYREEYGTPVVPDERTLDLLLMRAEKRLVRRNGLELFERNRWYWSDQLLGQEGSYVEVRWDPRELGKVLVYTKEGFLCEAFNLEMVSFHPSLDQLREYKRMKRLQREVALAHLELMHSVSDQVFGTHKVRHLKGNQQRALAPVNPSDFSSQIFTSEAARRAWAVDLERRQLP